MLEGRYQIEGQLGEGGVGVVYRALQLKLHRHVAVKLLLQDHVGEEEFRPRFQQEAMTLAALSHPHIVKLQDFGMVRGRPFLVMELLEGRTLRELLDVEGALTPVRALTLLRQLALALAYAHERGVVHRDLKPANLFVRALPSYEHVTVLDFGMVKLLPSSQLARGQGARVDSRAGYTFGTPAYMSPEHTIGADVDGRSDLYAVGVLLFELLTGHKPFEGEVQDVLRHHLTSAVPQLAAHVPALAALPELQALVERAMAKEADDRFADAAQLVAAFDELLMTGLLTDVMRAQEVDGARTSLWRDRLEAAAKVLHSRARASRELLRGMSHATWTQLRPRVQHAAERVTQLALEAKSRVEARAHRAMEDRAQRAAPLSLPPPRQDPPPDEPAP